MLKKSCFLILFLAIVLSLPKAILALTGDFDGSGIVDGKDLMKFARSFGSKPGDFNWNPAVDVDNNSVVNGNDLMSFAVNFGKSTPPAPSNFKAAPGNGQVSLTWTNPTNADFAGVKVVRKTGGYPASVTDGTSVYTGTGTS